MVGKKTITKSAVSRDPGDQSRDSQLGALSQWCSWWHSTGEGVSGPEIQESSIYANGRDFRLEKLMCKLDI